MTYDNHYKTIADTLKTILSNEWPEFDRPGRFIFRDVPYSKDFHGNRFFRFMPSLDETPITVVASDTVDSQFMIDLIYYNYQPPEYEFAKISDMVSQVKQLILRNRTTDAWHDITRLTIDYGQDYESGRGTDAGELNGDGDPIENLHKVVFELDIQTMVQIYEN